MADEHGRIVRDNVFGKQEDDAERRDFTINALFYNPTTEEILDYLGSFIDIQSKTLRIIGDPSQRYREDPVRMLRGIRLSAKLGLTIETETLAPIASLAPLLTNVPASRLFDEMLKLLLSGHAAGSIQQLRRHGLHHGLLPLLDVILEQPLGERFVTLALNNTDQRIKAGKTVSPSFMFAALLWHEVLAAWQELQKNGLKRTPALMQAMDRVIDVQAEKIAIPRRYGTAMKEIWGLQPRFENRAGRRPLRLLKHPRFRAGFDFLVLRCDSGEVNAEIGKWWESFQIVTASERNAMLAEYSPKKRSQKTSDDKAETDDDDPELDFNEGGH
jgi:poly(A) polymerase